MLVSSHELYFLVADQRSKRMFAKYPRLATYVNFVPTRRAECHELSSM